MTILKYLLLTVLLLPVFDASAAGRDSLKVSFAYDVDFDMHFDNREFYRSSFSSSMTIFGARLTPSVGIALKQKGGLDHKVMAGIDVMKEFGASPVSPEIAGTGTDETSTKQNNLNLFREITLYYRLHLKSSKNDFALYAGIFPRRTMEGSYSPAFFSDSLKFYDNNLEGILLKLRRPKAYFELGCDWMGQYGTARRERFMLFSSGEGRITPCLSLGYSAYMYHFAGSRQVVGVVDNALVNPYMSLDLTQWVPLQTMSLSVGWLQSLQQDRLNVGKYVFPCGGEFTAEVRKWNAGVRNSLFYGTDMMPYYNSSDAGGVKYGNMLYLGEPFYRVHDDGSSGWGLYDKLEVYYAPRICRFLDLRISALFHFNKGYSGCQQIVSLRFNLQELLDRR